MNYQGRLETTLHYSPAHKDHVPRTTITLVKAYSAYMSHVDRLTKDLIRSNVHIPLCGRRYHHQIHIGWTVPSVAYIKSRV